MAITPVAGSAVASAPNGQDVTLDLTDITDLQEGDLVIAVYSIGTQAGNHDMAETGGTWTEIADLFSDDGGDTNLGVFRKFMGATPDTSVTFDGNGNGGSSAAAIAKAFRGVDPDTPLDVAVTTATGTNTMHPDPASIDFLDAGAVVVIAVGNAHQTGGTGTYTFPTGYTTGAVNQGADDTVDTTVGLGWNESPADPENPGSLTHSGTDSASYSWAAVTIALRPAAGSEINGSGTATLGAVAASGAGNVDIEGTGAATVGPISASGAGTVTVEGSGTADIGPISASGAGTVGGDVNGSGTADLKALTASGAGTVEVAGSGTGTLGAIAASGSGAVEVGGDGAATLVAISADGTGSVIVEGSGALTLAAITMTGSATQGDLGSPVGGGRRVAGSKPNRVRGATSNSVAGSRSNSVGGTG